MDYSFDSNPFFLSQFDPIGIKHWIERTPICITRGAAAAIYLAEIAQYGQGYDKLLNGIVVEAEEATPTLIEAARFLEVIYTLSKSANIASFGDNNLQLCGRGAQIGRLMKHQFLNWVTAPSVFVTTNTYVSVERSERYKLDYILKNQEKLYILIDDTPLVNGDILNVYVTLDYFVGNLKGGLTQIG